MTQTKSPPKVTAQDGPGRPSAATVRKVLIQALATSGSATAKELEDEVGRLLPAAERPSITQQLQVLREGEYVIEAPDDRRRMTLSDAGRRWWRGIEALAPRAA